MAVRFSTPTVVATLAALGVLSVLGEDPMGLVRRHFAGEWGGQPDNAARNEEYLRDGEGMLLSIFRVGEERVWVISHIGGAPTRRSCYRRSTNQHGQIAERPGEQSGPSDSRGRRRAR